MKRIVIIIASAVVLILIFLMIYHTAIKLSQSGKQSRSIVYAVGTTVLKKEQIQQVLTFSGSVEGDPQVKVYPQVSGKFWGNAVEEGSAVGKDSVLAYINRDVVGMNYQLAKVLAPVAGVVKKLYYADRGANVSLNQPVAEIANPANIKVILSTGESDLFKIKSGMPCLITASRDEAISLKGYVTSVTPFVDSDTLAGSVIVKARNPAGSLMIGASADVSIIIGKADMFMAPQEAILSKLDKTFVFLDDNGIARQTEVTQGYVQADQVEIRGGFKEGDILITQGAFKLSDGTKIRTGDRIPEAGAQQGKPGSKTKKGWVDKKANAGASSNNAGPGGAGPGAGNEGTWQKK